MCLAHTRGQHSAAEAGELAENLLPVHKNRQSGQSNQDTADIMCQHYRLDMCKQSRREVQGLQSRNVENSGRLYGLQETETPFNLLNREWARIRSVKVCWLEWQDQGESRSEI